VKAKSLLHQCPPYVQIHAWKKLIGVRIVFWTHTRWKVLRTILCYLKRLGCSCHQVSIQSLELVQTIQNLLWKSDQQFLLTSWNHFCSRRSLRCTVVILLFPATTWPSHEDPVPSQVEFCNMRGQLAYQRTCYCKMRVPLVFQPVQSWCLVRK
jgi:hypothetical protein